MIFLFVSFDLVSPLQLDKLQVWCSHNRTAEHWRCLLFYIHVTCIVTNFLAIKPTRCTNFSNLFWNESLHVSDSSSVHHQELFTVHSTTVYVIQVRRQHSCRILLESCLQTCMTYTIAECTVNNSWWWTKEMSETCRVSFPK
jgi:hypothetical protein